MPRFPSDSGFIDPNVHDGVYRNREFFPEKKGTVHNLKAMEWNHSLARIPPELREVLMPWAEREVNGMPKYGPVDTGMSYDSIEPPPMPPPPDTPIHQWGNIPPEQWGVDNFSPVNEWDNGDKLANRSQFLGGG